MAWFRLTAVLLHTSTAAVLTYGWLELGNLPNNAYVERQKGGHFQFLTIQGLVAAWLTMVLSLITDLSPIPAVVRLKRLLFMIAMPLAVVISSIYWTLLLFFPKLILRAPEPGEMGPTSSGDVPDLLRIDLSLDLALHAVPGTALILDFYLFEEKYPNTYARYIGAAVTAVSALWYSSWVEYCASYNGIFPYPFLTFNPFPVRVAIYFAASLFAYLFFQVLNAMHS